MEKESRTSSLPTVSDSHKSNAWLRPALQIGFLVYSMLIGWQFHRFVQWLGNPETPQAYRPASVEAWLPISSLLSFTQLLRTGQPPLVRPAGLVIFSLILFLTILAGRGFCSWVCPIGTLNEWGHKVGRRIFGRNLVLPRWIDIPLRGIKYFILGFFLYAILGMSLEALRIWIEGSYNRIADVKMYLFFAEMSQTKMIVLAIIIVMSLMIKNFWCRYLCPYGAFLAIFSWFSPIAVRRNQDQCNRCGLCDKACPNRVRVSRKRRVASLECTMCYGCVQACPKPGALAVTAPKHSQRLITLPIYAAILLGAFIMVTQLARSIGYWESSTPVGMYVSMYSRIHQIPHP